MGSKFDLFKKDFDDYNDDVDHLGWESMIISTTKNFLAASFNFFIDLLKFSQKDHFLKKHTKDFERKNHLINLSESLNRLKRWKL